MLISALIAAHSMPWKESEGKIMFGLMKITPSMLTSPVLLGVYKGHYCGLCHSISRQYSQAARLLTSYEVTFMRLVLEALQQHGFNKSNTRCPVSLFGKEILETEHHDVTADISLILAYEKMIDDEHDEERRLPGFMRKKITRYYHDACNRLKLSDFNAGHISTLMKTQRNIEKSMSCSMDSVSRPTALMMAYIFGYLAQVGNSSNNIKPLRNLGFYLGKWLYLMDALVDLEQDSLLRRFNPLVLSCGFSGKKVKIHDIPMNLAIKIQNDFNNIFAELEHTLCSLRLKRHYLLIRGILLDGLGNMTRTVLEAMHNGSRENRQKLRILQLSASSILTPEMAFAASGHGHAFDSCASSVLACGIMAYALRILFRGCCGGNGGCMICDNRPRTVQVEDGCGGRKTYRRGWDGKYREECC